MKNEVKNNRVKNKVKNNSLIKVIFASALILVMTLSFCACNSNSDKSDDAKAKKLEQKKTDATVGTDVDGRKIDDQSFYGKWISDSAKSMNIFDGFEITFNEDGTYVAEVTGETIKGTWQRDGEKVTIVDEDEILPCNYTYTQQGGLKMIYEGEAVGFHR